MTHLDQLNDLLARRLDLPEHRRHVPHTLSGMEWLRKHCSADADIARYAKMTPKELKSEAA